MEVYEEEGFFEKRTDWKVRKGSLWIEYMITYGVACLCFSLALWKRIFFLLSLMLQFTSAIPICFWTLYNTIFLSMKSWGIQEKIKHVLSKSHFSAETQIEQNHIFDRGHSMGVTALSILVSGGAKWGSGTGSRDSPSRWVSQKQLWFPCQWGFLHKSRTSRTYE